MPTETTYTDARANLAALCDRVASSRQPIIIHRRGAEDVALVNAAELRSLTETAHLLRSPKNAQRLIMAIVRARAAVTKLLRYSVTQVRARRIRSNSVPGSLSNSWS